MEKTSIEIEYTDTCFSCYLTDHHNRDGEALIGIALGVSKEDAINEIVDEFYQNTAVREDCPSVEIKYVRAAAEKAIKGVDLERERFDGEGDAEDHPYDDEPFAWFLVTWDSKPQ
jgi:hypothetical protein